MVEKGWKHSFKEPLKMKDEGQEATEPFSSTAAPLPELEDVSTSKNAKSSRSP